MQYAGFLLLAVMVGGSALGVILMRNPIHAALLLTVNLAGVAALYLMLQAQFLALVQVIVYAGAIVVLFLFVIMLLNLQRQVQSTAGPVLVATAGVGGIALALLVVGALRRAVAPPGGDVAPGFGETTALARQLFTVYLLPFELTSILLLVAIVGAVALAKKD